MLVQNLQADRLVLKYLGLKESGIIGVPRLLLILTIFSSIKWTNLLVRSTAEEMVEKSLSPFP